MPIATVIACVDTDYKRNFIAFCSFVGLNTFVAVSLFIKNILRENCITFDTSERDKVSQEISEIKETNHAL